MLAFQVRNGTTNDTGYLGIALAGLEVGSKLRKFPGSSFQRVLLWQAGLGWLGLGLLHISGIITSRRMVRQMTLISGQLAICSMVYCI